MGPSDSRGTIPGALYASGMANDLTESWEMLTAVADVQQRLAGIRPIVWERSRLATAEHTVLARAQVERTVIGIIGGEIVKDDDDRWTANETGSHVVVEISVMIRLRDGGAVTSAVTILAAKGRWRLRTLITLDDDGKKVLWQGPTLERGDVASFRDALEDASKALVDATVKLDLNSLAEASV